MLKNIKSSIFDSSSVNSAEINACEVNLNQNAV